MWARLSSFDYCVASHHHFTLASVQQSSCTDCVGPWSEAMYERLRHGNTAGVYTSAAAFERAWTCVCSHGGYDAMQEWLVPCTFGGASSLVGEEIASKIIATGGPRAGATTARPSVAPLVGLAVVAAAAAAVAVKIRRARAATGAPTEPAAPMM